MRAEGVDLLFVGLSSDLEYLSGVERGIPFFGQSSYPHGWVAGGFFRPDADPVFVLPRMVVVFDLPVRPEGEIVVVDETDDGSAVFENGKAIDVVAEAGAGEGRLESADQGARADLRSIARGRTAPPRLEAGSFSSCGGAIRNLGWNKSAC